MGAVNALVGCQGKVVVTGIGKSGHVARKIASTLSSTGTPSMFLHPAEALHGDLGVIDQLDVLIAIAFGGETQEVLEVANFCRRAEIPVIAITGKAESTLATLSNFALDGRVEREACYLNLAPSSSSTVTNLCRKCLKLSEYWGKREIFCCFHWLLGIFAAFLQWQYLQ